MKALPSKYILSTDKALYRYNGLVILDHNFKSTYPITPLPISSSSKYQATNCPSVIADCGASNNT